MVRWVVGSILHGVDPLCYFLFQPVLHDWCNKGRDMCYHVCGMMHIKEPLLLIEKSSPCGGSRFPLSLSEWSFTICPTPYNRKYNVLIASLNKTFPFFHWSAALLVLEMMLNWCLRFLVALSWDLFSTDWSTDLQSMRKTMLVFDMACFMRGDTARVAAFCSDL